MSTIDGGPCCENGCHGAPCTCTDCPICYKRVPEWIIHLKPYMRHGKWVGPHCVCCDFIFWIMSK